MQIITMQQYAAHDCPLPQTLRSPPRKHILHGCLLYARKIYVAELDRAALALQGDITVLVL